jgi:hypothetical protein
VAQAARVEADQVVAVQDVGRQHPRERAGQVEAGFAGPAGLDSRIPRRIDGCAVAIREMAMSMVRPRESR